MAQPRLCKVAVQNSLGQETCQQLMQEGKTCTCSSAGVAGDWLHFLAVPWFDIVVVCGWVGLGWTGLG